MLVKSEKTQMLFVFLGTPRLAMLHNWKKGTVEIFMCRSLLNSCCYLAYETTSLFAFADSFFFGFMSIECTGFMSIECTLHFCLVVFWGWKPGPTVWEPRIATSKF